MCYLFAVSMAATSFSAQLNTAMVDFDKNFYTFCTSGSFVCSSGFALSFGSILVGIMFVTFLFVSFQKCCNKTIEY